MCGSSEMAAVLFHRYSSHSLAHMFTDLNYSVLYEGIENEDDENRCNNMYARYLQGYKYSKPIPIERLTEFFEKREKDA